MIFVNLPVPIPTRIGASLHTFSRLESRRLQSYLIFEKCTVGAMPATSSLPPDPVQYAPELHIVHASESTIQLSAWDVPASHWQRFCRSGALAGVVCSGERRRERRGRGGGEKEDERRGGEAARRICRVLLHRHPGTACMILQWHGSLQSQIRRKKTRSENERYFETC
jgi:hypothetical protein